VEDWVPRYNIAPTQPVAVICQNPKEPVRELDDALGIDSVMGERLVRRGQNDQREVGNSLAVLRSFLV